MRTHPLLPLLAVVATGVAAEGRDFSLPDRVQGSWDVSREACDTPGTSVSQIDITKFTIDTFGGDAIVRDVEWIGSVTFAAADYLQTEGMAELGPRERTYFRLTQRAGPDRLNLIWKDIMTVDLVRCEQK